MADVKELPHCWHVAAAWSFRNLSSKFAISIYREGAITKEELLKTLSKRHDWRPKCCEDSNGSKIEEKQNVF